MPSITILQQGEADDDVLAHLGSPKGIELKQALIAAANLPNDIAFASRPNTGDFNTDSFKIPANAYSQAWPAWKETVVPLTANQVSANFGSWNNQGTLFTFSKGGLYQVNGSFGLTFIPGDSIVNAISCVIRLILAYGSLGSESKVELSSWQTHRNNTTVTIDGGQGTFTKNIRVTSGQTVSLVAARTRYISTNGSDSATTGLGIPPSTGSWVEITQLRSD